MNPTFINYEVNENPMSQRGQYEPLGIATVGIYDNQVLLRFIVKSGKDGKGYYISEFSQKLNGEWSKSCTIDSNVAKEQIEALIKKNISKPVESKTSASIPTYKQPSFEEVPF